MDAWRSDLLFLEERLPARHPDPYHTLSEEGFRAAVRDLRERVPSLAEHERLAELTRLMALIGDGHTSYPVLWDASNGFRRYPVEFFRANDGVLILSAARDHRNLLGATLVTVTGHPAGEVLAAVEPLDSRDHELAPKISLGLMAVPEILHAVGITASPDSATFGLRLPSGEIRSMILHATPRPEIPRGHDYPPSWRLLGEGATLPLWLRDRDDAFWLEFLAPRRTLYLQYNDASVRENDVGETLPAFTDRLLRRVRGDSVERIVLDLRWNDGGAAWISRTLLQAMIEAERALGDRRTGRRGERDPSGRLFVLIGPGTFSAGTLLAAELEWHTNAVFVGEPTGGRPNAYGETGRIRLPATGYEVRTSIAYMQGTEAWDHRPAIFPDVAIRYRVSDLRDGVDPAMEAVYSWPRTSVPDDHLVTVHAEEGLGPALATLDRLEGRAASVEKSQRLLHELASHLDEAGRGDDALNVLTEAVQRFPWAAWAYARRASIHHTRGETKRAVENACRAYALSYYRTGMLDILDEHSALECARRGSR